MAKGYHRLSFRARHILRQLGKAKNITLQKLHLHELRHAISRRHGFRGPKKAPQPGTPGLYQRPSRKLRHLIRRLRHSRTWAVQKRTVTEMESEVGRAEAIARAKEARRARAEQRRIDREARRAAGRPGKAREWVQRKHEPLLTRAERRQADRKRNGYRGPFRSARAHRRWGRQNARRQVPGVFARFAARRGWTRLQDGHDWTPAARRLEARAQRRAGTPARTPRAPSAPRTRASARPAPRPAARTRT
jgi:hypothetical protein